MSGDGDHERTEPSRRHTDRSRRTTFRVAALALFLGATASYLVLVTAGAIAPEDRLGTPELLIALAAVTVAFVGSHPHYLLDSVTVGSSTFATATIRRVERRQELLAEELRALRFALKGILTNHQRGHLALISSDEPALLTYGSMGWKLVDELHDLDARGFVTATPGHGIVDIKRDYEHRPDDEFDLHTYVRITADGREYLALQRGLHQDGRRSGHPPA